MHSADRHAQVMTLVADGLNDCEIARRTALPRSTVRYMRVSPRDRPGSDPCPRCWRSSRIGPIVPSDYTELLALYLGDGYVDRVGRTSRLRFSLDARYPSIVADTTALLRRVFPRNRVALRVEDGGSTLVPIVYSNHLACLLPQHGPGKKHEREIRLEPWQRRLVREAPWPFLRGLIRSDGCCFVNRTGPYTYECYAFHNYSPDVLDLFSWAADLVGVEHRRTSRQIRVNRRSSVSLMLRHVGRKR